MNAQTEQTNNGMDIVKRAITAILLAAAVVGNSYFTEHTLWVRVGAILVIGIIALLVAATTTSGQKALGFARESRIEARKVVWPTRNEYLQTTLIIMVAVVIMSLVLWGLDGILVRLVAFILGQEV